jgi:hypothetical protein
MVVSSFSNMALTVELDDWFNLNSNKDFDIDYVLDYYPKYQKNNLTSRRSFPMFANKAFEISIENFTETDYTIEITPNVKSRYCQASYSCPVLVQIGLDFHVQCDPCRKMLVDYSKVDNINGSICFNIKYNNVTKTSCFRPQSPNKLLYLCFLLLVIPLIITIIFCVRSK